MMYDEYNYWSAIPQSLNYLEPGTPVQFPQSTQSSPSYGPTHTALSDALKMALLKQAFMPGLLSPADAQAMGLLSPNITPSMPVMLPAKGPAPKLGPNQYYDIGYDFWNKMPGTPPKEKPAPVPNYGNPLGAGKVRSGSSAPSSTGSKA